MMLNVVENLEKKLFQCVSKFDIQEFTKLAKLNNLLDLHILFKRRNGEHFGYASIDKNYDVIISIVGSISNPQKILIENIILKDCNEYRKLNIFDLCLMRFLAPFLSPN